MTDITAEVSTTIEATPARVWTALTDPHLMEQYFMGARAESDWKVGSPITWSGTWKGKAYQDKGEILEFDPSRRLRFSHWSPMGGTADAPENYHVVDFILDSRENEPPTKVTLTQSNLDGEVTDADRSSRSDYESNWSSVLDGLKRVVED